MVLTVLLGRKTTPSPDFPGPLAEGRFTTSPLLVPLGSRSPAYPHTLSPPLESHDARVLGMLRHQSHPDAATPWVCKTVATADDDGGDDDGDDDDPTPLLVAAMSHT